MANRSFRVLILPSGTSKAVECRLSQFRLFVLAPAAVLVFLTCAAYAVTFLSDRMHGYRLRQMEREKTTLNRELQALRGQLTAVDERIDHLVTWDEDLRKFADLPPIPEDIREVGVGGSVAPGLKVSGFFRSPADLLDLLGDDLGKFERLVDLEMQSYSEIAAKLEYQKELNRHLPSIRPVAGGRVTAGFGRRADPITGGPDFHNGIDINDEIGAPVYATADGIVVEAGPRSFYGNYVRLDHQSKKFGYETAYGHLRKILVKAGQQVKRGDVVAEVGKTGRVTARHLHYEVWVDGKAVDPLQTYYDPSILE